MLRRGTLLSVAATLILSVFHAAAIDRAKPHEDFAGIATPPYRGTNHRYLEGRGRGTLRITDMTLGNTVPGAQAWFETLDFDAELCRPS